MKAHEYQKGGLFHIEVTPNKAPKAGVVFGFHQRRVYMRDIETGEKGIWQCGQKQARP